MFCMNCGTKLPDKAKFCFNCGVNLKEFTKDIEESDGVLVEKEEKCQIENTITQNEKKDLVISENKNIILNLGNRKIELPPHSKEVVCIDEIFSLNLDTAVNSFTESFNDKHNDLDGMLSFCAEEIPPIYQLTINQSINFLNSYGYYDAIDVFSSYLKGINLKFVEEISNIEDFYDETMKKVAEAEYNRELRKASRGRWEGGGFGISGAIKGAITAKVMNSVSGAFHSIANEIGNINTRSQAEAEFNKIYKNKEYIEKLTEYLCTDILTIREVLEKTLLDVYGIILPELLSEDKKNKSIDIYDKLVNKEYKDEEVYEKILDMLELYPRNEDYYEIALVYKLDEIYGIKEYAEFFMINYTAVRQNAVEEIEYNNKLNEKLGDAADLFESVLDDNVYYENFKFEYKKNLIENIEDAIRLKSIDRVSYIYKSVDKELENKLFRAFEEYAHYENEVPILYYEERSDNKVSKGIVLTNKSIYFTNEAGLGKKLLISDIDNMDLDGSKLSINNEFTSVYMMASGDRALFMQLLWYLINIIRYSKLSGISSGAEIPDIIKLRENYYGNGAQIDNKLGDAKTYLENNLSLNHRFHEIKEKFTGNLEMDINVILCDFNFNRAWYIFESIDNEIKVKIDNAISTYANIKGEVPLIIYDATAFGSAKEGFLITEKAIYVKKFMSDSIRIEISNIKDISIKGDKIVIDGNILEINMIDANQRVELSKTIEILLHRLIAEKYCPKNIKVELVNKLKLNRFFNYEQPEGYVFVMNKEKTIQENILDLLSNECNPLIRQNIFLLSDGENAIKRYNNASKIYKPLFIQDERALLLYDNTASGNGKEGLMITSKGIIFKNIFSKPKKVLINNIDSINFKGTDLLIAGEKIFTNNIPKHLMNEFSILINKIVEIIKEYQE